MTLKPIDLLLSNAKRVVSGNKGVYEGFSIAIDSGKIKAIGPASEIAGLFHPREEIDATGKLITPGFVDSHTHVIFGGQRAGEFVQRCAGADQSLGTNDSGYGSRYSRFRCSSSNPKDDGLRIDNHRNQEWIWSGSRNRTKNASGHSDPC